MIKLPAHVEALTSQLLRNRITMVPSKPILKIEQVRDDLLACYVAEVRFRNRQFIFNEDFSNQLQAVAAWLIDPKSKPWLILCGKCGNGKTTMAKALRQFYNLHRVKDPIDNSTMGLVIVNSKEITEACRSDFKTFLNFSHKPMLAIDDLGIEPRELLVFGNVCTPIVDLITDRYEQQRVTHITTNLTPGQIREHYGDRIADRLNEMACKIIFRNESYRIDPNY